MSAPLYTPSVSSKFGSTGTKMAAIAIAARTIKGSLSLRNFAFILSNLG
jgi:hypothetical protein